MHGSVMTMHQFRTFAMLAGVLQGTEVRDCRSLDASGDDLPLSPESGLRGGKRAAFPDGTARMFKAPLQFSTGDIDVLYSRKTHAAASADGQDLAGTTTYVFTAPPTVLVTQ